MMLPLLARHQITARACNPEMKIFSQTVKRFGVQAIGFQFVNARPYMDGVI